MENTEKKFTALIIMDGFGIREVAEGNAIKIATTPQIDALKQVYPNTQISASGLAVGLPEGQMGNSEVGHLNIGAGRIVYQELTRITKSIEDGDFFDNAEFNQAIDYALNHKGSLHLLGLLSDGGVHSHMEHMFALVELAKQKGLKEVFLHCFMDGRDVAPDSGKQYVEKTQQRLGEIGVGKIATLSGRFYAMDRDNRWERIEKAYFAMTKGEGRLMEDPVFAMQASYEKEEWDEFITPTVITENGLPLTKITDGDAVIFFNFRPDRSREMTRALSQKDFTGFSRNPLDICYVCMTPYDETFSDISIAFKKETIHNTLGEYLGKQGLSQFRIAETEKYAHVTFFFNGGEEKPFINEDRYLIASPKVDTYDQKPEMSAYEVAKKAISLILEKKHDVMILNFANADMVGHTGDLNATVQAIKVVDECVGDVVRAILQVGGQAIITADHGNAEYMIDEKTAGKFTAHTTNKVPFILVSDKKVKLRENGILADVAPTLIELIGLDKPEEMTGKSIIQ